jgi:hypothetical protein
VANNPYVKRGWRFIDQTVGNAIRNRVSPYRNNNIVKTLNQAQQNVRSGGPPKIPPGKLPTCSQIQGRTKQEVGRHILEGGRVVLDTVASHNPVIKGVPRMVDGMQVIYNTTSGADPGAARNAVGGYARDQAERAIQATASALAEGKDPTEGFDAGAHIVNEITGGE